jgi:hypothetical protein
MSRHFRPWTIVLLPAAVVDYVPADHLAQFVVVLAREHLDVSEIVASYKGGLGQPPFDPRMMTALLLYAYCSGLSSPVDRAAAIACGWTAQWLERRIRSQGRSIAYNRRPRGGNSPAATGPVVKFRTILEDKSDFLTQNQCGNFLHL